VENWAEHFLDAFKRWAETDSDILGVAVVGSFARGTASPSSDIDLMVLTIAPVRFLAHTEWATAFGIVQRQQLEDWGAVQVLRAWYLDGREVEFGFALPAWASVPAEGGTRSVVKGGLRVLFDRGGVFEVLRREIAAGR
jgi:predicted nucleotidyltransferase